MQKATIEPSAKERARPPEPAGKHQKPSPSEERELEQQAEHDKGAPLQTGEGGV